MKKAHPFLRNVLYLGIALNIVYFLTGKKIDWLGYTAIAIMFIGFVYNTITDWKAGRKKQVTGVFITIGVFLLLLSILYLVKKH